MGQNSATIQSSYHIIGLITGISGNAGNGGAGGAGGASGNISGSTSAVGGAGGAGGVVAALNVGGLIGLNTAVSAIINDSYATSSVVSTGGIG